MFEDEIGWWVRSGHLLAGQNDLDLGRIAAYPVVSQRAPAPYKGWLDDLRRRAARDYGGARVVHALQLSDYGALLRILSVTDAVGLLPVRNALVEPRIKLKRLDVQPVPPPFTVAAARLRTTAPSPLAERFIDLLRDTLTAAAR